MPLSREEDFLRNTSIFYPNIISPWRGGPCNSQCLVSWTYRCYILNLVKIGPVILEKKMLTDDDGRQPIAIGHLSDSGELKSHANLLKLNLYGPYSTQWFWKNYHYSIYCVHNNSNFRRSGTKKVIKHFISESHIRILGTIILQYIIIRKLHY